MAVRAKKTSKHLSESLVLAGVIWQALGFTSNDEMLKILRSVEDGYDEEGKSFLFHALISRAGMDADIRSHLEEYDENIHSHLERINKKRPDTLVLKYYQYLTALATEMYLDWYFRGPMEFLRFVNTYARKLTKSRGITSIFFTKQSPLHLLAYWMATGSGKTILMHLNYLQFIHYNTGQHHIKLDNILLITPNERLTTQHLHELELSSIPAGLFQHRTGSQQTFRADGIQIIEITKLTTEKTGDGLSVDITQLGTKNLIFVDEGHKGSGGDAWFMLRDTICKDGFAFEYSATFGQAVMAGGKADEDLLKRYSQAILIDYSYRHFYEDGYGKEFNVLNVSDTLFSDATRIMVMYANLLSFYQQWRIYHDHPDLASEYKLEPPLWIYIGSKVIGKKSESGLLSSDVYRIVEFLHQITTDPDNAITCLDALLAGTTDLNDKDSGEDIFAKNYPDTTLGYVRALGLSAGDLYTQILIDLFRTAKNTPLHLARLKGSEGEILLRYGNGKPFGLINIGDDKGFADLVTTLQKGKNPAIAVEDDSFTGGIFNIINKRPDIIILIGAKKFIEGWDSFRVSSMGLFNIGKREGPEIIQLFGRGIRLKGKDNSLKRSGSGNDTDIPDYLSFLETLSIYGIEAEYLATFREFIGEGEEIRPVTKKTFYVQVRPDSRLITAQPLYLPKVEPSQFRDYNFIRLYVLSDNPLLVTVDLLPVVEQGMSTDYTVIHDQNYRTPSPFPIQFIDALNWDKIVWALDGLRNRKGWHNLIYDIPTLKQVLTSDQFVLSCRQDLISPKRYTDLIHLEEIATAILKKYLTAFYHRLQSEWAKKNLDVENVTTDHPNINFRYTISVSNKDERVKTDVETLLTLQKEELFGALSSPPIKNVYWSRHLYQPLLAAWDGDKEILTLQPTGINKGEETLVKDLAAYLENKKDKYAGYECFLLRNRSRLGVGLFETAYFYPDYIFWMIQGNRQQIVFLDPHGLAHNSDKDREKQNLCKTIRQEYEPYIGFRLKEKGISTEVLLDAYIISVTDPHGVHETYTGMPTKSHVIHQQEEGYIKQIFDGLPILNLT